jgi:8-oxo-dGTP pyrophosphatase MutT (NUDIX family)
MTDMTDDIDSEGFRANVGIILANADGKLLLAGRIGNKGWQFPQGGMLEGESDEEAMYRELYEEVGLVAHDVEILGATRDWLRYRLPERYVRRGSKPLCIGQLAVGGFLETHQRGDLLQAPRIRERAARTRTARISRRIATAAALVARSLACRVRQGSRESARTAEGLTASHMIGRGIARNDY